jgi:hypothetical protein
VANLSIFKVKQQATRTVTFSVVVHGHGQHKHSFLYILMPVPIASRAWHCVASSFSLCLCVTAVVRFQSRDRQGSWQCGVPGRDTHCTSSTWSKTISITNAHIYAFRSDGKAVVLWPSSRTADGPSAASRYYAPRYLSLLL